MSELPDKFEAVDPVTGTRFSLRRHKNHAEYFIVDEATSAPANQCRALIQYGRDLERAEIETALKVDYDARKKAANNE